MKNENYEKNVKQIVESYKKNLAKLMRKGQASDVVSLLNDSGPLAIKDKNMYDIARKSISTTSIEELEIQRVNFVFTLLNKNEREIIVNEFLLSRGSLWWVDKYSRSTYYRLRKKASKKFIDYYGIEKK